MRVIKRALCILVILALAVSVVPISVSASALSVVGTSFSSAGLTSAEFVASAGSYAIGILAALAAAYGIKTFVQSDTAQAVKEFYQDLIEERAAETRRSVAEEMEVLLGNATIGEQGNIVLGRLSFAEAREILLRENIPVEKPETVSAIYLKNFRFGNALSYTFHYVNDPPGEFNYIIYSVDKTSTYNSMFFRGGDGALYAILPRNSNTADHFYSYHENIYTGVAQSTYHPYYQYKGIFYIGNQQYFISQVEASWYENSNVPYNNYQDILEGSYTLDDLQIDYADDTLYGVDETLREQNVGLNDGLVLAPDLINSAVLGGASGQITASDYCGALVDYVSGYDTVIDGVTVTGLPEASTVPRTIDEAPTSATVIDEAPPSTMTGTEAAGLYSFSLDELFPFCLPFDFVKIIEKFNVEPEAPNFDWRFYIPGIVDYTLHLDLSAWNTAAEVCRTMVLIAFMVGLIMLTRQIFIRA